MGLFDFLKKNKIIKQEVKTSELTKEKKSIPTIDVSDKIKIVKSFLEKNYEQICNYPEINQIEKNERLLLLKTCWDNWSIVNPAFIKNTPWDKYDKNIIKIIFAMENSRLTKYCLFFNHLKSKNLGLYDFLEFYTPEEHHSFVKYANGKYTTSKKWIRVCHIEDFLKTPDIYRRTNGSYYAYIEQPARGDKETKKVFLFKNNSFEEMTSEEFRNYCHKNNYICPLWVSNRNKEEIEIQWAIKKQKMEKSFEIRKKNGDNYFDTNDLTQYFMSER